MEKQLLLRELKARYKQLYNAVQPIPYIRDRLYCVSRVFVEGGIEYLAESWLPLGSYHLVFSDSRIKSYRRILIGEPGYGKSTLTLQYAYDWCIGVDESCLKNVEILILLRLRQLRGVKSIYEAIRRFILSSRAKLSETDVRSLIHNSKSVLVILDGYDEYPDADASPKTDIMKVIHSEMFEKIDVVLTTRYLPQGISSDSKRLKLIGFDDIARDKYIRKAVVGDDVAAANRIKQRLQENPVLGDVCQVPLFFVMFAHMSHENKDFQTFKTVTSFFQYMIHCFHSHMRNKMDDTNVQRYHLYENDHSELNEVAFEGLSKKHQQIVWNKEGLVRRLGMDFYDQYIRVGILVEEENIESDEFRSSFPDQVEVRFYHKVFCEWYAAHYLGQFAMKKPQNLSQALRNMNPSDVQYCYRFACGLVPKAAGRIIENVRRHDGGDKFAVLCLLEQGGRVEKILHTVKDLCSKTIQLEVENNTLLQRSTIQLLEIASGNNISISRVWLNNCYSTVDLRGGNHLQLKSNLSIPVLTTLNKLLISTEDEGREITSEEFTGILQYSSKCLALKELRFFGCLLPPSVQAESVSVLRSRNVEVFWRALVKAYQLNLQSGQWERTTKYGGGLMTDEDYQKEVKRLREWWGK